MNPFLFLFPFLFFTHESVSQQTYSGNHILECNNSNKSERTPEFLYTCNGIQSCSTFLIFKTQPLYNTIFTISKLMSTDPTDVARINGITDSAGILPLNKELIIPVTCSCSGLTTCDSLQKNNIYKENDLQVGGKIRVPLRCACPTNSQTMSRIRFLLTYSITWEDSIKKISKQFDVKFQDLVLENRFCSVKDLISPFTNLLVPLSTEPLSTQTRTFYRNRNRNQNLKLSKKGIMIGTISGGFLAILCGVFVICLVSKRKRANKGKIVKLELPKDIQLGIFSVDQVLKVYKFEELEEATDGFTLEKRLSASVYKGSIKGRKVAIKQTGTTRIKR
ncbi:unnamed protein product [Lactuca saligna]|uniref:LysM domain-containing protein n=1 Tax=Lactuca saligna TaxID=75948 RepID=A0AA36E5P8_LACSI|nr:unnamed protein product [Lactuca saligna]